ncbi:MAG: hypothetical protein H6719_37095 [Sandaracinaceae bacterium]|nr:hypothetical protein [Sandaracinaceae bacterium]
MRASMGMVLLLGGLAGCSAVNGDGSWGEENRSLWRIDDGLCPGTEGGCGLEVPVASGVEVSLDANVPCAELRRTSSGTRSDCDLHAYDVSTTGAGELRSTNYDTADARIDVELVTVGVGDAAVELREADGALFDRVTLDVRDAVDIECGSVGPRGAAWDMPSLDTTSSYGVSTSGSGRVTQMELGCRLIDDRGLPLFSGASITWRITEGADVSRIDDGGLFGGDSSTGARIYVHFEGRGTIRLLATFGDLSREIVIDVT